MTDTSQAQVRDLVEPEQTKGLYGAVWRWHFYAGLFSAPLLMMLAITGALYLFNHEIEEFWYRELMIVQPAASPARPAAEQEAAVLAAHAGARVLALRMPRRPDLAAEWSVELPTGGKRTVFVDPWRARVLGDLDPKTRLMSVVSEIHGSMMIGRTGDTLVELAACWGFVLVVTGLYLWWPRNAVLAGIWIPRLTAKGRTFWRDLHAVPAAWNALFLAFLIVSGLPWAGFYGDMLAKLGTVSEHARSSPHFRGAQVPSSTVPGASREAEQKEEHVHHESDSSLPWSVKHAGVPNSGSGPARIDFTRVMAEAERLGMLVPGLSVAYPRTPSGVFKLGHPTHDAFAQRTVYLDQYSAKVLGDLGWDDYSALGKATEIGVTVHMGRQFGLANQLIGLLVCLGIVLTSVTALVMWWRRRPRRSLGAPSLPRSYRTTRTVAFTTLGLAVVFPLVGASLIAVLIIDTVWKRML